MACSILLTCPTLVTPISFRSRLASVNSSLPLMSFLTNPSMYSDNCSVSNQVATSWVPQDATSLAVLWLCCCCPAPAPFVRNFSQNKPLRLCSDWKQNICIYADTGFEQRKIDYLYLVLHLNCKKKILMMICRFYRSEECLLFFKLCDQIFNKRRTRLW